MGWNHRVMRHVNTEWNEVTYKIHEVYYGDDDKVAGWTEEGIAPQGATEEELKTELNQMLEAFNKPTLDGKGYPVNNV